jgi:hypothetical protein
VKLAAKKRGLPGGKDALRKFNKIFNQTGILKVGCEILIRFTGHGKISLVIDGRPQIDLDNPALTWAFLDMFLGPNTVAANVKASIADGFPTFLHR